ncbi:hypothetical protein SUGI_0629390, partial [Cryptomeria japonica]
MIEDPHGAPRRRSVLLFSSSSGRARNQLLSGYEWLQHYWSKICTSLYLFK